MAWKRRFVTRRGGQLTLSLLVAAGVVIVAIYTYAAIPNPAPWLKFGFVVIFLGAIISTVMAWRQQGEEQQRQETEQREYYADTLNQLLLLGPPLPRVDTIDPFRIGVSPSDIADKYSSSGQRPPYVRRDQDGELDKALMQESFVLIVGNSKAGKSRSAFEAIGRYFPHHRLIVPREPAMLRKLFDLTPALGLGPEPAILWLDDLERFLQAGVLDTKLLDGWNVDGERCVVAVATIRIKEYTRIMATEGEIGYAARQVLRCAAEIPLSSHCSATELPEAKRLYPAEDFGQEGIAEHLVAAKELLAKVQSGAADNPAGLAVVSAAVDWRRCGLTERRVTETDLKALYGEYLPARINATNELFEKGLTWACEPIGTVTALLQAYRDDDERSFLAFDYITDHIEQQRLSIPAATWSNILHNASPTEALEIGFAAYTRSAFEVAERSWATAVTSDNMIIRALAAYNLGVLRQEQGDVAGARAAYEQAIASEHPDMAPIAAVNLGLLLEDLGRLAGARTAYEYAITSRHTDMAPKAAFNLGLLLKQHGEVAGARAAYEQAIVLGHPDMAPKAMVNLAVLLQELGDVAGATVRYEQAITSGHADQAPKAMVGLGKLLEDQGDVAGATVRYEQAITSGHADQAPRAAYNLGVLLQGQKDVTGARAAYERAIASGDTDVTARAAFNLGVLLEQYGDVASALDAYCQAVESGHSDVVPIAAFNAANLRAKQGDRAGAIAAYRVVLKCGHTDAAPKAALRLGLLLQEQGDTDAARAAYQYAARSGHEEAAPRAKHLLELLLDGTDESPPEP